MHPHEITGFIHTIMPDIFTSSEDNQQKEPEKRVPENKQAATQSEPATKPATTQETAPQNESATTDHTEIKPDELKDAAESTMEDPQDAMDDLPEKLHTKPKPIALLSHYCPNPIGISFVNQERDEKIILFLRRHFITNTPWIATSILLLLLPIITFIMFRISNLTLFTIPLELFIILLSFYYLVILNYMLTKFIEWFYHVGIVTKKRMLDIDVDNILHHHLSETNIADIVDVSYSQTGFFQSFFNYGNVPIQTEARKANFEFEAAPQPTTVSDVVADLRQRLRHYGKGRKKHA